MWKCKVKGHNYTCYSAAYMSQACDQQALYTISQRWQLIGMRANDTAAHYDYMAIHCLH